MTLWCTTTYAQSMVQAWLGVDSQPLAMAISLHCQLIIDVMYKLRLREVLSACQFSIQPRADHSLI